MSCEDYGPLEFFIGKWKSESFSGENRAPDSERQVENTKFKQEMVFTPIGEIENHEQKLMALEYKTLAWEEGDEDDPFHQEVGYWLWDPSEHQLIKSFIVPRGISVLAGGTVDPIGKEFELCAKVGDETYGICSNKFLDQEFRSIQYKVKLNLLGSNSFSYEEETLIKIKNQMELFSHTEKNTMKRKY